ncbi:type II toxin-antitoxin system RelE/ParE family toxin [Candidatus Curtissbacteria bacterium]|nr:type II toxin-antitoxin system RelE/ParE family toxin [Candidatus Curtissbacteria bacterium]
MAKFKVEFKKSAVKQLKSFPQSTQTNILNSISARLVASPYLADGKHIKKLTDGYRLRVGNYRIFYYLDQKIVVITSIIRRTSTTY